SRWTVIESMCPSRRDTTRRNEARGKNTIRRFELWDATSAESFTRCSKKNANTRFAPKKGIPRPRSGRDRRLKRKYGSRKFQTKGKITKSTNRARNRGYHLEISCGMFRSIDSYSSA